MLPVLVPEDVEMSWSHAEHKFQLKVSPTFDL